MTEQFNLNTVQQTLSNAPVGILLLGTDNKVLWHNNTLESLLGLSADQLSEQSADSMAADVRGILIAPPETIFLQHGDQQRWIRCHRQDNGDNSHTHFYLDITQEQLLKLERDKLAEDLQQLTTRDTITGLPNRLALLQGLEPLISRSRRYENPLSIVLLSLSFEGENDVNICEKVWTGVGLMLKDQMRWADIIGRYNGSDFLLILPETEESAAKMLAEKLNELISDLSLGDDASIKPTAYWGVTGWTKGDDANLMLKRIFEEVGAAKNS